METKKMKSKIVEEKIHKMIEKRVLQTQALKKILNAFENKPIKEETYVKTKK